MVIRTNNTGNLSKLQCSFTSVSSTNELKTETSRKAIFIQQWNMLQVIIQKSTALSFPKVSSNINITTALGNSFSSLIAFGKKLCLKQSFLNTGLEICTYSNNVWNSFFLNLYASWLTCQRQIDNPFGHCVFTIVHTKVVQQKPLMKMTIFKTSLKHLGTAANFYSICKVKWARMYTAGCLLSVSVSRLVAGLVSLFYFFFFFSIFFQIAVQVY